MSSTAPITIIVGENGTGKSTLLEGIAVLAGYDEAGGGKGYRPVDHSERDRGDGRRACRARCARAGCPRSRRDGSSGPRASSPSRDICDEAARRGARAGFPLAFPRRRLHALLRGALPAAGNFHLRRTGIGAVALAADRIPEAAAADGRIGRLPGHHGDPFADADGLSRRAAAADVEIRAGASDRSRRPTTTR